MTARLRRFRADAESYAESCAALLGDPAEAAAHAPARRPARRAAR